MSEDLEYISLLSCPRCQGSLCPSGSAIICETCGHACPIIAGIPWVFEHPEGQRLEWLTRYNLFIQSIEHESAGIKEELRLAGLLPQTVERLRRLLQAKVEHAKAVAKLLAPLGKIGEGALETSLAAKVRLPENQSLMGYYANVIRDWGWDTAENKACLEALLAVIPRDLSPQNLVVFGAGACRLPVDLHETLRPRRTLAIDINPFLLMAARKIIRGQTLNLYEFPIAPRDKSSVAIARKCLRAGGAVSPGFHLLLADGLNAPLKAGSFDTALTPWFVDIVPQDFREFALSVNRSLKVGGVWLNFGSLAFHHARPSLCYSRDEALAIVEGSGFEITKVCEDSVPYLVSPDSCQTRHERVFTFSARKLRDLAAPEKFSYLPLWLEDHSLKVPKSQAFDRLILVNRTYADIVSQVDGQRSITDVAELIAPSIGLSVEAARGVIAALLTNIYETTLRGNQF